MTTFQKVLLGFTAGVVVGVLYAPYKGSKTRTKLNNAGLLLKNKWNNATDLIADQIDNVRQSVDNVAYKAIEKVESTQFDTPPVQWKEV